MRKGEDASPLPTFSAAGEVLGEKIKEAGAGHYIHATGQHYSHDPSKTRNLVMKVGSKPDSEEFTPNVVLDAALSDSEFKILNNILRDSDECRFVSRGEIDSVGSEDWRYGYSLSPNFSIFTPGQVILQQNTLTRGLLQLNPQSTILAGETVWRQGHKIWMKDIENVFVNLSPRPWNTQTIGVGTLAERVTLLQFERDCLEELDRDAEDTEASLPELENIMLHTDWIVKVAAQLVHVTTQNRPLANKHVPLFVPRVIQADINPWVELRNSLWATSVPDKLEKSHEDYIP